MSNSNQQRSDKKPTSNRMFLFPIGILLIYAILFLASPDKAEQAIKSSGKMFLGLLVPLVLVFFIMLLINLFLKPAAVAKFLGKGSGVKSIVLSASAGIISTWPIYVWYPLLKDLRDKGAGESSIAIFLYNRAVKTFLITCYDRLLRLALRGNTDHNHGFSVSHCWILREFFLIS